MEGNLFFKIAHKVTKLTYFYQILEYQETRFHFRPFKIQTLLPDKAIQTYKRIQTKYESSKQLKVQPEFWYESQKRLFAWFIAFYTYIYRDKNGVKTDIDFSLLSPIFFNKNAQFLQFHFLILLKTSDKVYWDEVKDQMLLDTMKIYGTKWNEVSKSIFMSTNKEIFRSPKNCRQRWLNHLDNTKVRGNWTQEEDIILFEFVVENESKSWSKLVNVLGGKRTQHTIKNRFNAMIAKHRRYKLEKDIKVAKRILEAIRGSDEVDSNRNADQKQSHAIKDEADLQNIKQLHSQQNQYQIHDHFQPNLIVEYKEEYVSESQHLHIDDPILKLDQIANPLAQNDSIIKADPTIKQQVGQAISQWNKQPLLKQIVSQSSFQVYPFENYSYDMEIYNKYSPHFYQFQATQMMYYQQQLYGMAPTSDSSLLGRQQRLLEERRRRMELRAKVQQKQ